ncbi:MAG: YrdB family protein [Microbacterium sp.]
MSAPDEQPIRRITALDVLRFLSELAAFAFLALWGFFDWPFAWNILFGIATPALAIVLWALFVSPKAVFAVHPFVRILAELLVFLGATMALWSLGYGWFGLGFGVVAVAIGFVHRWRSLS